MQIGAVKMVSVVIPVYNRAKTIERSIQSVLGQTYKDIEVLVVDDCSDDGLENVIRKFNSAKVRYFKLESRSGACAARNKGIKEARGDYIAFQDSDDEWLNTKLETQLKMIIEKDADICFCRLRRHYCGESAKTVLWPEDVKSVDCFMDHVTLRRKSYASTQTIVARRYVFDKILFDPKVVKSQDYDWIIRASEKYKVYFIGEPLVEQYLQHDSISMSGAERFVESRTYLLQKYSDLCKQDKEFFLHLLKQLAYYKSLGGMNAAQEYKKIYSMEKTIHNAICVLLSSTGLMKLYRRMKTS